MIANAVAWLMKNLYNYMIPLCLLCVLRVVMCRLELRHMKHLREKKFVFRSVSSHYKEIGTFIGLFIGFVLICLLPLKLLWAAVAVVLGIVGFKIGKKKGDAEDEFWREVIAEVAASGDGDKLDAAPDVDASIGGFIDTIDVYDEGETAPASDEEKAENEEA